MPEKCASDGYSSGKFAFVHVLLMITVYSAGAVGAAGGGGGAGRAGGAGGEDFELFPQATRASMKKDERRARMTASFGWRGS
jgi:hypothetical protein